MSECVIHDFARAPPSGGFSETASTPVTFEEIFFVASWEEHLRQHRERLTAADIDFEDQAKALSTTTPETEHLFSTETGEH